MAWDKICKDKGVGGLEIKNLGAFNMALLRKWVCQCRMEKDMLWHRVLVARYGRLVMAQGGENRVGSMRWRSITRLDDEEHEFAKNLVTNNLVRRVGDGREVRFWQDVWVGENNLGAQFPHLFSLAADKEWLITDLGGMGWR